MKGTFHIGEWEIQPQLNSLRRADRSFHVEPKVMQVLVELASHSDEVVTKEQLIHAVWADTFVGDDSLTRCISEIRRVLEDDARSPKFIQTIPKTGYRMIAPVEVKQKPRTRSADTAEGMDTGVRETQPTSNAQIPVSSKFYLSVMGVLLLCLIALALIIKSYRSATGAKSIAGSYTILPFTSYPGAQTQPAFSPDGKQLAFVWNGDKSKNQHIYIKMIATETPLRLTSDSADDFSPVWSPDGRSIAFLRDSGEELGIYIVPALGGPPRKAFTPAAEIEWERGALSWAPDGKTLIFADGKSSASPSSIYALDLSTGNARPLTKPPKFWDGDACPAFSPDGSKIAFARGIEGWVRDVYVMNTAGGDPVRLTFDERMISSLTWTADGSAIVFSSNRAGKFSLWRVPVTGGAPSRLPVGSEDAFNPSIARTGEHLAYTQTTSTWSIKRVALHSSQNKAVSLWSSSQEDSAPQISPDGRKIAFQSSRSGTQEIWVAASDGANPVKLTSFEKSLTGSPSWSPDGTQLAFDARPEGRSHIYSIRLGGGQPRALTSGAFNDIIPSWSRDGRRIYFGSNRNGTWQIWKVPSSGGMPEQVTKQGGFVGVESYDGKWLYYVKADVSGTWRIPLNAEGSEQKILDEPRVDYWGYWSLTRNGIYFLNPLSSPAILEFAGLTGQHRVRIHTLEHTPPPYAGLTVAPDERSLLYSDRTEVESHVTLVNDFR